MKILHTGDVHLDSPFAGLSAKYAEARRRDVRETFSEMMAYAADEKVDMVIISGDLFETGFATRDTVAKLRNDFEKLSCPIIITPGNHDPAGEGSIWEKNLFGENVYVFKKNELEYFSFDELNCDVYGWAFTSQNMNSCPLAGNKPVNPERINIAAGHCDVMSPISKYCPTPVSVLQAFGADYCALGHIHNPEKANEALDGAGLYCGCPEGRDFGECGEKGALVAEITKQSVNVYFHKFCKKTYKKIDVNIDGAADYTAVSEEIYAAAQKENITANTLLRVNLKGSVDPAMVIDTESLAAGIRGVFYAEVKDETVPVWNSELLSIDKGIRGEVYRYLLPKLESEDIEERAAAANALRYALASLNGGNISDM